MRPRGWEKETDVTALFSGAPMVNVRRIPITLSESMNKELFLIAKSCSKVDLVRNKCWTAFSSWRSLPCRSAIPACKSCTSWMSLGREKHRSSLLRNMTECWSTCAWQDLGMIRHSVVWFGFPNVFGPLARTIPCRRLFSWEIRYSVRHRRSLEESRKARHISIWRRFDPKRDLFQMSLDLILRHLFFLNTILQGDIDMIPLRPHIVVARGHQLVTRIEQFIRLRDFTQGTTNIFFGVSRPCFRYWHTRRTRPLNAPLRQRRRTPPYVLSTPSIPS